MILFEKLISILSILLVIVIGGLVFVRNPKALYNKLYALGSMTLLLLTIFNYLGVVNDSKIIFVRVVLALTTLSFIEFYFLILYLDKKLRIKKLEIFLLFLGLVVIVLDFSKLVFIQTIFNHRVDPIVGWGIYLFILDIGLVTFLLVKGIVQNIIHAKDKTIKKRYVYLLIAILPSVILAPITSLFLYIVLKDVEFNFLTPIYPVILFGVIGFLIIKEHLYNIRSYVVKGLLYFVLIILLVLLLEIPSLYLVDSIFNLRFSGFRYLITTIIFTTIILMYPFLQKKFVYFTNKIFYRDLYDVPKLISDFNNILVTNNDLNITLKLIKELILTKMKIYSINFFIYDIYDDLGSVNLDKIRNINKLIKNSNQGMLNLEAQNFENNYDFTEIALIFPLNINIDQQKQSNYSGFILFGKKKNGQLYNYDDINTINTLMNSFSIALKNILQFNEIKNLNANLEQRINEATLKLRQSNDKLKQLDASKDDFISMASHQLRTPLTSVKGYLSMLLEGDAGPINESQKTMLNQAFFSAQKMVYLIADLLNVSRIKTGKFLIENKPSNLANVVEEEVNQLVQSAENNHLSLSFNKPDNFPNLMLDETKIRQVIMNFIDNAIYYTPSGGKINVSLVEKNQTVEFKVKDNGIGVSKKDQHRLFSKFYRADNARAVRPDGTGLGLYMAKKVIIGENGSLIFESNEGKGSTFGFILSKDKLIIK